MVAACLIAAFVSSCSVEENKSTENEVGLENLTKDGSISLQLEGKRPDGVGFFNASNFNFTPVSIVEFDYSSSVKKIGDDLIFNVERHFNHPADKLSQNTNVSFKLRVRNAGLPNQSLVLDFVDINEIRIVENIKGGAFVIDNEFDVDGSNNSLDPNFVNPITNVNIENYSYDEITNKLKFDFSFDVAASANVSNNDLKVNATVNVVVYELKKQLVNRKKRLVYKKKSPSK